MSDLKEKIKKALLAESRDMAFGITGYSYGSVEDLDEAKAKHKAEKSEKTEKSEKSKSGEESETSGESSSSECSSSEYESTLTEAEVSDIKLSAKSLRSLAVASLAESLVNETINEDEDLSSHGLLVEGKLTGKGRELLKKFLPTLFAS